jgi:hypothetical protein
MLERPAFIQGLFAFEGLGLDKPVAFAARALYQVPADKRAQTVYFRAGNPSAEMIYLVLTAGGRPCGAFRWAQKAPLTYRWP